MEHNKSRIVWVDYMRAICMIAILLFHTEMYYVGDSVIPYSMYVENALVGFFFISGYLFSSKYVFNFKHKINFIVTNLIYSYIIFGTIIMFSKSYIFDRENFSVIDNIINVLTGQVMWFIPALILSSLMICLIFKLFGKYKSIALVTISIISYIIIASKTFIYDLRLINISLMSLIFMCSGYLYRIYEFEISKKLLLSLSIIVLLSKVYIYIYDINMTMYIINIDSFTLYYVDTILSSLILISVCKWAEKKSMGKENEIMGLGKWIGSHTLVIFYLCGGIPRLLSVILPKYNGNYLSVIIAFILVCVSSISLSYVIYKYFPKLVRIK